MKIEVKTVNFNNDYNYIKSKLREYNISQVGMYGKREPVFFGYYDDENNLIAGLYGYLVWGMLYLDLLWVSENYRNKKLGKNLMYKAEEFAKEKEALYIRVNTATFQALDFYEKCGYEIFAKLPLKIEGHKEQHDYYLIKYLE
ncbi:MAG: GNAT family N-acetyltransferase [Gammaproteobacteria bacterium]|jgi:ribosomal protein S18 acetylase RimI-like enzyme